MLLPYDCHSDLLESGVKNPQIENDVILRRGDKITLGVIKAFTSRNGDK